MTKPFNNQQHGGIGMNKKFSVIDTNYDDYQKFSITNHSQRCLHQFPFKKDSNIGPNDESDTGSPVSYDYKL